LDHLENGDQIIVYYKQKKFVYEVHGKTVITPGDVSVLKKESKEPELSVMTCWPIGTTLKRLVVNAKLVSQK
jgi:sortase A